MKVFVKTLKGTQFEIEVQLQHTVADVKKIIETVKNVYPAAQQMLYHQGKLLKDDATTMEENGVSENSFIVVMLGKKKSSSSAPPPTPVVAEPPHPSLSDIFSDPTILSPSAPPPLGLKLSETAKQEIYDDRNKKRSGSSVEVIKVAKRIRPDLESIEDQPPVAGAPPPPESAQPAPATGPNTSPLDLFPQDRPDYYAFQSQPHPHLISPAYEEFKSENPQSEGASEYDDEFIRVVCESADEGGGGPNEAWAVTLEDLAAITRLEAMGFDRNLVVSVYFVFAKDEQLAADFLIEHYGKPK